MSCYKDEEFENIVSPILGIEEFNKLKYITHHGITRYDHSMRVAYFSYKASKSLKLDYKEVTEAALLHDFFLDEVNHEGRVDRLRHHPDCAVKNASKYFNLSDKQVDIIKTHMFPVTFSPPKYLESWIVDMVDNVVAVMEAFYVNQKHFKIAANFLMLILINYLR